MIKIKSVIHDLKTNSVEATWVDQTTSPDILVPEVIEPDTTDEAGNIIPGLVTPEHTIPGEIVELTVKCHSYADVQMDMFRADIAALGGDVPEHEALIALVESNIKPPEPVPVVIPAEVTMRQARLALLAAGKLSLVNAAINAMPSPQKEAAQIEWEYSNTLKRDNLLVLALGPALGMSDSDIDALFTVADTL